ncbi:hypothetical protein IEQ11_20955 [Lysobacter capsici]|uniref:hypothetical protein n=1 Tax=Lysobacter capsici TaxID=435897 RepID=UPI001784051C|nr:hypothetical protein [Lysobacter capsici]UOF14169.1 hypothetical protein IEQ11_20955 [Lysobacter capsici]
MRGRVFLGTATWCVAVSLAFAGPSWAGDTVRPEAGAIAGLAGDRGDGPAAANAASAPVLVAEYQVRDARGERRLVLVRSADRIEYRMQGEPVEVWRKTPDGIARLELFAKEQRSVSWSPGDLRTIGEMPRWEQLASPINPELRARLQRHGEVKAFGGVALRYRGESAEGQAIALEWIEADGLPAYYRAGKGKASAGGAGAYELRLLKLDRVGGDGAFTATSDYRETDYADLGDMELDPFAANYLKHRGDAHAH